MTQPSHAMFQWNTPNSPMKVWTTQQHSHKYESQYTELTITKKAIMINTEITFTAICSSRLSKTKNMKKQKIKTKIIPTTVIKK
ncbi:hypothetical protein AHYW_003691 [Providencia manganoxydans]|uniref:hypothetical protein n=1 Tax=Providencia manganoxydans TaxID=2923283 RepID=UPI003DA1825D